MPGGLCKDLLEAIGDELSENKILKSLNNPDVKSKGINDVSTTISTLSKCFSGDQSFWEHKLSDCLDSLQPINVRAEKFTNELLCKRQHLRSLLISRLRLLESILEEKSRLHFQISDRERSCLKRLSHLKETDDEVLTRASEILERLIQITESTNSADLSSLSPDLFQENEALFEHSQTLDLETMLLDHERRLQALDDRPRPPDLSTTGINLTSIIHAVESEKRQKMSGEWNVKSTVGFNRNMKNRTPKQNLDSTNASAYFAPPFYQYIRGFFNVLRLFLLEIPVSDDEGLSTDEICDLVHLWQSHPRAQRTNSPWINRCSDWSLVTCHALTLLSITGTAALSRLLFEQQLRVPESFVVYNETSDRWSWLLRNSTESEVNVETALLARIFSIWVKASWGRGGLRDVWKEVSNGLERSSALKRSASRDHIETDYPAHESKSKSPAKACKTAYQVPPPYFPTEWECKLSTPEQRRVFQAQEAERFSRPLSPFVYNQHGYASVVGPVRTASLHSSAGDPLRAREHPLLRSNRHSWVSISEIVRDAVARLPNGEGTRQDIALLVQDSAFLVDKYNPVQLSQCISSALDRLQAGGINSPVMYESTRRLWVYRYRHLSPNEFSKLFEDERRYNEVNSSRRKNMLVSNHNVRMKSHESIQFEEEPVDIEDLLARDGRYFNDEVSLDSDSDVSYRKDFYD